MATGLRSRDSESEAFERDAFALLRQIYASADGSTEVRLLAARVADRAAMDHGRALSLVEFLTREGYLLLDTAGPIVALTPPGKAYIEQLAWRRQSVRQRWTT